MMNSQALQHSGDNTAGDFQSPAMGYNNNNMSMNMNNNMNNNSLSMNQGVNDLQFTTSVDTSVRQNVPIPAVVPASQIPMTANNYSNNYSGSMNNDMNNNGNANGGGDGNETSVISQVFPNSAHPIPCLFHCLFKAMAVIFYIFSGWLSTERYIITTVTCVVLLAMDFWCVKNVTGRLLVGLRWWSQNVGEDGLETKWIFESNSGDKPVNSFDQSIFWTVLYVTPMIWCGLFLVGFMKLNFKWLITVSFGIALSAANTYGYYQCSQDQKSKFQQMMVRGAEIGALSAIRNSNAFSRLGTFASGLAGFGAANASAGAGAGGGGYANVNPNSRNQQHPQQFT